MNHVRDARATGFFNSLLVLRAAARLWDHFEQPEIGQEILLRSDRTRLDPWLLAAEVALASRAKRSPRLFKRGLQVLESRSLSANHLSELAGAIGTQLLLEGKRSKALPHFQLSLKNPTENAIAQAGWAQRRKLGLNVDLEHWSSRQPEEARAWAARTEGHWEAGVQAAAGWLKKEPFSTAASACGIFMACIAQDYERAFDFALSAWHANPSAMICANNLAFIQINRGNLDKAHRLLERARHLKSEMKAEEVAITATSGLLCMRRGQIEAGRQYYSAAIERAKKLKNGGLAAWAAAFRAREELRIGSHEAARAVSDFEEAARSIRDSAIDSFRREFGILPAGPSPAQRIRTVLTKLRPH